MRVGPFKSGAQFRTTVGLCEHYVYSYHTGGVSPPYQLGKGQVFSFCFVRIFSPLILVGEV